MKNVLMLVFVSVSMASVANASKMELVSKATRTLKGPTRVTLQLDSRVAIQNFNKGLVNSSRSAVDQLKISGSNLKVSIAKEENIIKALLLDGSLLKMDIITSADGVAKKMNSRMRIYTSTKSETMLNDINDILAPHSESTYITKEGMTTLDIQINVLRLSDANAAILKLTAAINEGTLGRRVVLSRKTLSQGSR